MMQNKIKGTILEQTRVYASKPYSGDMADGRKASDRKRSSGNKIKKYRAININGTLYYPTSMVAWFLTPAKKRRDPVAVKRVRAGLVGRNLSFLNMWRGRAMKGFRNAFIQIDGHWFTNEERFNAMWTSNGHDPVKFKSEITVY